MVDCTYSAQTRSWTNGFFSQIKYLDMKFNFGCKPSFWFLGQIPGPDFIRQGPTEMAVTG